MKISVSVRKSLSYGVTRFGDSTLGQTLRLLCEERSKNGVLSAAPVEISRHLFRYPQDLARLSNYIDGNCSFMKSCSVIGAVLTFHPSTVEVSIAYLLQPNEDVLANRSRFITPIGFSVNDMIYDYAAYVSGVDHIWSRIRTL